MGYLHARHLNPSCTGLSKEVETDHCARTQPAESGQYQATSTTMRRQILLFRPHMERQLLQ